MFTLKKPCHRGFTLIELMIVIVILGVLMGTILPRLTGAQARARDTGRVADLNTISQALETYYDDNGDYPAGTACLGGSGDTVGPLLAGYLKGGKIPMAPSTLQQTIVGSYSCTQGEYLYVALENRGIANNGYALATDVETAQNANVIFGSTAGAPSPINTSVLKVDDGVASTLTGWGEGVGLNGLSPNTALTNAQKEEADTLATNTIYMVVQ